MYFHVWFITKYRKALLVGDTIQEINQIFVECIHRHDYKILELQSNVDHMHMLVEAGNRTELANIMRVLKSISAKEILRNSHFDMKGIKHFWGRRYGARAVRESELEHMKSYIRNQRSAIDKVKTALQEEVRPI